MYTQVIVAVGVAAIASSCSSAPGPVDSGEITITINTMNPSDIRTPGTIEKDENISAETNNPWGKFVREARDACAGDPVAFEVLSARVALDVDGSQDVAVLEDVINGAATIFFASTTGSDSSAVRVDVASAAAATGLGPVSFAVGATQDSLASLHQKLVGGDFHVGLRAATTLTDQDNFSMDVRITLSARAFCE